MGLHFEAAKEAAEFIKRKTGKETFVLLVIVTNSDTTKINLLELMNKNSHIDNV